MRGGCTLFLALIGPLLMAQDDLAWYWNHIILLATALTACMLGSSIQEAIQRRHAQAQEEGMEQEE